MGDDWYRRRQRDAEGRFLRRLADQRRPAPEPGGNCQGIYCFAPSGKLLVYKNHQDPDVMRSVLRSALRKWQDLPAGERRPGALAVPERDRPDGEYVRTPPKGGAILTVHERILDKRVGRFVPGTCTFPGGNRSALDRVWLREAEWRALIPATPRKGDRVPMPGKIHDRLVKFHLVDFTRGEPTYWPKGEVRKSSMEWTVEEVTPLRLKMRLTGSALLSTKADLSRAERGFDVALLGYLEYDREKKELKRFDMVAVGGHWGDGDYTPDARPGRRPLGLVFELTRAERPADRLPPHAARDLGDYFGEY